MIRVQEYRQVEAGTGPGVFDRLAAQQKNELGVISYRITINNT